MVHGEKERDDETKMKRCLVNTLSRCFLTSVCVCLSVYELFKQKKKKKKKKSFGLNHKISVECNKQNEGIVDHKRERVLMSELSGRLLVLFVINAIEHNSASIVEW